MRDDKQCTKTTHAYNLEFYFRNELTKQDEIIAIVAQVINSRFDLIIGLPDMRSFDLFRKFPSLFDPDWINPKNNQHGEKQASDSTISKAICGSECSDCAHLCSVTNPKDYEPLRQRKIISKEALLDPIPSDWDEIDGDCPWDERGPSETSDTKETANRVPEENISGDPELQQKIITLINAYADVFSSTLTREPARVDCFELKVDTEKWLASAGGKAPRTMRPQV
jgi:hypothetical protein